MHVGIVTFASVSKVGVRHQSINQSINQSTYVSAIFLLGIVSCPKNILTDNNCLKRIKIKKNSQLRPQHVTSG
jgi:hypothetical protein